MDTRVIKRVALYARVPPSMARTLRCSLPSCESTPSAAAGRSWRVRRPGRERIQRQPAGADKMMADAHARKFDGIAVWKLDRLGRSLKHLVTTIEDLGHYGVSFVSLRDNMDLSTPAGRLMMHIIGAMAEFERSLIQERVVAGIAAARKRGVRMGRPKVYLSAMKVRTLREAGTPWRAVAKKLDCGVGTAMKALREVRPLNPGGSWALPRRLKWSHASQRPPEWKNMTTTPTALDSSTQPINQAAVVDAALRAMLSVYPPSQDFVFSDFAGAIRENPEAKQGLEELLHALGSDEEEDGRTAFGLGMVAGMLYAQSTGITLTVPPLEKVKAALDAQEALYEGWAAARKTESTPVAPQAV